MSASLALPSAGAQRVEVLDRVRGRVGRPPRPDGLGAGADRRRAERVQRAQPLHGRAPQHAGRARAALVDDGQAEVAQQRLQRGREAPGQAHRRLPGTAREGHEQRPRADGAPRRRSAGRPSRAAARCGRAARSGSRSGSRAGPRSGGSPGAGGAGRGGAGEAQEGSGQGHARAEEGHAPARRYTAPPNRAPRRRLTPDPRRASPATLRNGHGSRGEDDRPRPRGRSAQRCRRSGRACGGRRPSSPC